MRKRLRGSCIAAPPSNALSFDHSSARASAAVAREAEPVRGLEVDHQLVLARRLHRNVARLGALENAVDIGGGAPEYVDGVPCRRRTARRWRGRTASDRRRAGRWRAASAMIKSRLLVVLTSGSTMRPPSGSRAKASISPASPPASRTGICIGATAKERAEASITGRQNSGANGAVSGLYTRATRLTAGATSLSASSHLLPMLNSKAVKPVSRPPGRARLGTKPRPQGRSPARIQSAACRSPTAARPSPAWSGPRSGRGQARRVRSPGRAAGWRRAPSGSRGEDCGRPPSRGRAAPPRTPGPVPALPDRFGQCHQHADPARAVLPLRAGGDRPGRRATEQGDELPTPHGLPQPGNRHSPAKRITSFAGCTDAAGHAAAQCLLSAKKSDITRSPHRRR